mgnify:CR=1 FL=1|jgi:hypothetical protein
MEPAPPEEEEGQVTAADYASTEPPECRDGNAFHNRGHLAVKVRVFGASAPGKDVSGIRDLARNVPGGAAPPGKLELVGNNRFVLLENNHQH